MLTRYLWSRGVSWVGNALTAVALPVLLFQLTGSAWLTGVLTATEAVPYLLLGLPAGALVDRWDARRTLVTTSWLSAIVAVTVPIAAFLGLLTPAHLIVTAAGIAVLFVFFDAASFGALPAITGADGVAQGTSRLMTVSTIISIGVPPIGGILTTAIGGPTVLLLDAASYAIGAALLAGLQLPKVSRPTAGRPSIVADIREGLHAVFRTPVIRDLTLLGIGNSFAGGAVSGLLIVAAVRNLGLADDSPIIGVLYAVAAVGTLIASWLLPACQRHLPLGIITAIGFAVGALALYGWALSSTLSTGLISLFCWQAANTLVSLNGIVARQSLTPARLQGRVNTTARMIAWGGQPIGAAGAGALAELWDARGALTITAIVIMVSMIATLLLPVSKTGRLEQIREEGILND